MGSSLLSSVREVKYETKCVDLFRQSRRQVALLFVVPLLWIVGDVTLYGILFGLNHLSGDLYLNTLLMGCATFAAQLTGALLSTYVGRKGAIMVFWICALSGCLFYDLFHSNQAIGYACVILGKFGANGAFSMMFLITMESFPTAYRGRVYGVSNALARMGGILAPLIPDLIPHFMLFLAGLGVFGLLLSFVLV